LTDRALKFTVTLWKMRSLLWRDSYRWCRSHSASGNGHEEPTKRRLRASEMATLVSLYEDASVNLHAV
jgi:hypothetical protein